MKYLKKFSTLFITLIVQIKSGTYKENLKITKNLNIIGNNLKDTIIDGNQKNRCLYIRGQ